MRKMWWVVVVLVAVTGLAWASDPDPEHDVRVSGTIDWRYAPSQDCSIAGVWTGERPDGKFVEVFTPLDPSEHWLSMTLEGIDMDASFFGMFPGAKYTVGHGELKRIGANRFAYSVLAWAVTDEVDPTTGRLVIAYSMVIGGELSIGDGCSTVTPEGLVGIYGAGQDPFGPEAPAYGVFPLGGETATRQPFWSPPTE